MLRVEVCSDGSSHACQHQHAHGPFNDANCIHVRQQMCNAQRRVHMDRSCRIERRLEVNIVSCTPWDIVSA